MHSDKGWLQIHYLIVLDHSKTLTHIGPWMYREVTSVGTDILVLCSEIYFKSLSLGRSNFCHKLICCHDQALYNLRHFFFMVSLSFIYIVISRQ